MQKRRYPYRNRSGELVNNEIHEVTLDFARRNLFVRRMREEAQRPFWQRLNLKATHPCRA